MRGRDAFSAGRLDGALAFFRLRPLGLESGFGAYVASGRSRFRLPSFCRSFGGVEASLGQGVRFRSLAEFCGNERDMRRVVGLPYAGRSPEGMGRMGEMCSESALVGKRKGIGLLALRCLAGFGGRLGGTHPPHARGADGGAYI